GRRFTFQCPVQGLELQPGGYAVFGGRLGQVQHVELAASDDVELTDGATAPGARISFVRGAGVVLDRDARPFHREAIAPAGEDEGAAWLEDGRAAGGGGGRGGWARAGAPAPGGAARRRPRPPAEPALRPRRGRVRPAHVLLRPVGL